MGVMFGRSDPKAEIFNVTEMPQKEVAHYYNGFKTMVSGDGNKTAALLAIKRTRDVINTVTIMMPGFKSIA